MEDTKLKSIRKLSKIISENKNIVIKFIIFTCLILIIFPVLQAFFIKSPSFWNSIRTVFLLQKLNKIIIIILLIFIIISFEKLKSKKLDKRAIIFAIIAIVFLVLSFYTQSNYDRILNEGIGIGKKIDFDANRLLAPGILSDIDLEENRNIPLLKNDELLRRDIFLENVEKIPGEVQIFWLSLWQQLDNQSNISNNCEILMLINGNEFDITENYAKLYLGQKSLMNLTINSSILIKGYNELILRKECNITILMITQTTYTDLHSYKLIGGNWHPLPFDGFVWFIKTKNPLWFTILFKLGFIFRLLAIILLLLAVFGIDFFKNAFIKAKTEFLFAIPFSLIVYWFADFLRSYWLLLSKTVTASVYLLLKISMLKPRVFIKDGVPWIGARNFVVGIIETCSGIEGIAYFLLLYTSLLIFNWRKLNLKNALFAYIPGLIGVFLVNILRVYLTILVGVFYSQDFAVGLFHTNIGIFLFIVYFIVFWIIAIKFIRK